MAIVVFSFTMGAYVGRRLWAFVFVIMAVTYRASVERRWAGMEEGQQGPENSVLPTSETGPGQRLAIQESF